MRITKALILLSVFAISQSLHASSAYDHCFTEAGQRYGIDPILLKAIAIQESALNPNAVNSVGDIGLMQINPFWLPKLLPYGITTGRLKDPCVSANIGAWVLAHNFAIYGKNWKSVGIYHAGTKTDPQTKERASRYARRVAGIYKKLRRPSRPS